MARILQVCNTSFYLQKFLAPLVRGLVERGNVVECVCEGVPRDVSLLGPGVVVHPFTFPRENSPLAFANAIGEMRRLIRRGRYDCVDSHNRNASIVARVAAWLEQVPMNLYTAHGFYFHDDQRPVAKWATVQLEMALARVTDFTLSQSAEDVTFMTDRGYILPARIECIGNGIDTVRFRPRKGERSAFEAAFSLRPGRFRVATTGRLVKGKGFDDLLDAVAKLRGKIPEIELLIIGGNIDQDISPYQDGFLARARTAGLTESLVVTGITDKVEQYLATADVFVLPSYREGLPRSLLEAMSMELPAIATNIRGCREVVVDGVSGFLFEPHGVEQLASLLEKLHQAEALRSSLGEGGRRRILEAFSETRYVDVQIAAIHRLMGEPRAGGEQAASG